MTTHSHGKRDEEKTEKLAKYMAELLNQVKSIAVDQSPNSLPIDTSDVKVYSKNLRAVYDFLAQHYGYISMEHMIACAHAIIIAESIAHPQKIGPSTVKAIEQAQENIKPRDKKEGARADTKEEAYNRVAGYLAERISTQKPS